MFVPTAGNSSHLLFVPSEYLEVFKSLCRDRA